MLAEIKSWAIKNVTTGEAASGFFGAFQGRCTFFAIAFSIVGCYGWLVVGRDLTSFALFAGAIQALLVVRSAAQDYHERQTQSEDSKGVRQ
jgi:hypothetical protein